MPGATELATPQASVLVVSGSCWGYFRPFEAGVFSVERLLSLNARSKCSGHERAHESAVFCGQFIVLLMPGLPSWLRETAGKGFKTGSRWVKERFWTPVGQPARSVVELWPNPGETGRPRPPTKVPKNDKNREKPNKHAPEQNLDRRSCQATKTRETQSAKKGSQGWREVKRAHVGPNPAIFGPQPLIFAQPERVLAKPLSIAGAPRPPACFVPKFPALTLPPRSRVDARGNRARHAASFGAGGFRVLLGIFSTF